MGDESKPKGAWSDRDRLVFLVGLIEANGVKLSCNNAPRPPGRTVVACEQMMIRLKSSVKKELEAWKTGKEGSDEAEKPKNNARKRKTKGSEDDGEGAPPKQKGGRKKKKVEEEEIEESKTQIKNELELDNDLI